MALFVLNKFQEINLYVQIFISTSETNTLLFIKCKRAIVK